MNDTSKTSKMEAKELIRQLLAENVITYHKYLSKLTGSVTSAILLRQIYYWFEKKNGPFYKFKNPCSHRLYKENDSWTEELGFTTEEFDSSLSRIATKITKGTKRKEEATKRDVKHIITYFKNSDNVTTFEFNFDLYYELLMASLNSTGHSSWSKRGKPISLEHGESPFRYITENTTENNKYKKNSTEVSEETPAEALNTFCLDSDLIVGEGERGSVQKLKKPFFSPQNLFGLPENYKAICRKFLRLYIKKTGKIHRELSFSKVMELLENATAAYPAFMLDWDYDEIDYYFEHSDPDKTDYDFTHFCSESVQKILIGRVSMMA